MRASVITALVLFAFGVLGGVEWLRDVWRSRRDTDVDRHPVARALRKLGDDAERDAEARLARERAVAAAIAERLRRREVTAEAEVFDIEAATLGESRCEQG